MKMIVEITADRPNLGYFADGAITPKTHPYFLRGRDVQTNTYVDILSKVHIPVGTRANLEVERRAGNYINMAEPENNRALSDTFKGTVIVHWDTPPVQRGGLTYVAGKVFYVDSPKSAKDNSAIIKEGAEIEVRTYAPLSAFANSQRTYAFNRLSSIEVLYGIIQCSDPRAKNEIPGTKEYSDRIYSSMFPK